MTGVDFHDAPTDLVSAFRQLDSASADLKVAEFLLPDDRKEYARGYWQAVEIALHAYLKALSSGGIIAPNEFMKGVLLLAALKEWAGYLAVGQIPGPMKDAVGKGDPAPGPTETRHIRAAVSYREAVARKLIDDRAPIKTLMGWFGASRRTVQRWCAEYRPLADPPQDIAAVITARAQKAGTYHRQAGRSVSAISERAQEIARGATK